MQANRVSDSVQFATNIGEARSKGFEVRDHGAADARSAGRRERLVQSGACDEADAGRSCDLRRGARRQIGGTEIPGRARI